MKSTLGLPYRYASISVILSLFLACKAATPTPAKTTDTKSSAQAAAKSGTPVPSPAPVVIPNSFDVSIVSLEVKNDKNVAPLKGDSILMNLKLKNGGLKSGTITITPLLSSNNLNHLINVRMPAQEVAFDGYGEKIAVIKLETFFQDLAKREFALTNGDYNVAFEFLSEAGKKEHTDFKGSSFKIGASKTVFAAVFWSQGFLDKIKVSGDVTSWLTEVFSHKSESTDGSMTIASYPKGFDEILGQKTVFKTFDGLAFPYTAAMDAQQNAVQISALNKTRLGLDRSFTQRNVKILSPEIYNHGFDLEIALTEHPIGFLAVGRSLYLGVGTPEKMGTEDLAKVQLMSGLGMVYGANSCDLKYAAIMCGGETNPKFIADKTFVWHNKSIEEMSASQK